MARRLNQNNANDEQRKFINFSEAARKALEALAKEHGMAIPKGIGGRLDIGCANFKFEVVIKRADGLNENYVAGWNQMAAYDGLDVELLGQTLKSGHRICGYDMGKRSDKPYVLSKDGKGAYCSHLYIKANLPAART